jgi:hypothetical protein
MVVAACSGGDPPEIVGLEDQVAVVGTMLEVHIDASDPDGDRLEYSVKADIPLDAAGNVTLTQTPAGAGVFRWTPLARDVGPHLFDFTASDGSNDTTVSITIDVRPTSGTAPVFRQPLGAGTVANLASNPCVMLSILIEDQDTAQVTIAQEEPVIGNAILSQLDGTMAEWQWCPTPQEIAASDRYILTLSADDGDNPKTMKTYVIVLGMGAGGPHLVINEVEYDEIGTDSAEFIEIFNPGGAAASLAGLQLVLVNGANSTVYDTVELSSIGMLPGGKYLVVAGTGVSVPASALKLNPLWTTDRIQNGPPDGVALVDPVTQVVIDALSYEGPITAVMIDGFAQPVSLVEGTALDTATADSNTATRSICRSPNATDTDNAATDWKVCTSVTAGTANP